MSQTNEEQWYILSVIMQVFGMISLISSVWIILHLVLPFCSTRITTSGSKRPVYDRLVIMLSVSDAVFSLALFGSRWFMNSNEPSDILWITGNEVSCNFQGFAMQLGSASFLYNLSLAIYFVLVTVKNYSQQQLKNWELGLHFFPCAFGVITATYPLIRGLYHNSRSFGFCWINVAPECRDNLDSEDCAQYQQVTALKWALLFAPMWISFIFQMGCLIWIWISVHKKEVISRYHRNAASGAMTSGGSLSARQLTIPMDLPRTRAVASQGTAFFVAFLLTYTWATIGRIFQTAGFDVPFFFKVLNAMFLPSQGLLNFIVFRRPYYLKRRMCDNRSRRQALMDALTPSWWDNVSQALAQIRKGNETPSSGGEKSSSDGMSSKPKSSVSSGLAALVNTFGCISPNSGGDGDVSRRSSDFDAEAPPNVAELEDENTLKLGRGKSISSSQGPICDSTIIAEEKSNRGPCQKPHKKRLNSWGRGFGSSLLESEKELTRNSPLRLKFPTRKKIDSWARGFGTSVMEDEHDRQEIEIKK